MQPAITLSIGCSPEQLAEVEARPSALQADRYRPGVAFSVSTRHEGTPRDPQVRPGFRRLHLAGRSIALPEHLTKAQLNGRACVRCGAEAQPRRPVETWSQQSAQLLEGVDTEARTRRREGQVHA